MNDIRLSTSNFWTILDPKRNDVLHVDQVVQGFRQQIGNSLDSVNFKKLEFALDVNNDGSIQRREFEKLMAEAANYGGALPTSPERPSSKMGNSFKSPEKTSGKNKKVSPGGKSPGLRKKKTIVANKLKATGIKTKPEMVAPKNRLDAQGVMKIINELIVPTEDRIGDPKVIIEEIFDKIDLWKKRSIKKKEDRGKLMRSIMIPEDINVKGQKTEIHNIQTLWNLLQKFQKELDFNEDHIAIIAITSIDPNFFTHMLIQQSDFMKWFTTDFSGEGETEKQEEEDFFEDKLNDWDCITTLAVEMQAVRDISEIQDLDWWEKHRFTFFGEQLRDAFNQNKKSFDGMKKVFDEHQNRLSYFDFFTYLKGIGVVVEKDWEVEAITQRLDAQGLAYIEFNEFNEFLISNGYNTGI